MKKGEFITSDTHFGHSNVIRYSNRPFKNVDEMDHELIQNWNKKVPSGSIVYHNGDFSLCKKGRTIEILKQLNGTIRLIRGNHDKKNIKGEIEQHYFDWVKDYYESKTEDGTLIVMSHYAFRVWNKSHYGSINLFGHSHGSLKDLKNRQMDVGVDTHPNYEPYSFYEIMEIMKNRKTKPVDHHGNRNR